MADRCWIITDPTGREADAGGRTYHYVTRESAESDLQQTIEASTLAGPHEVRQMPEACVIVTSKCGYAYDEDGEGVEHLAPAEVDETMRDAGWRRLPSGEWHCGDDMCECGPLPPDDDRRPLPGQLALIGEVPGVELVEETNHG